MGSLSDSCADVCILAGDCRPLSPAKWAFSDAVERKLNDSQHLPHQDGPENTGVRGTNHILTTGAVSRGGPHSASLAISKVWLHDQATLGWGAVTGTDRDPFVPLSSD